MPLTDLAKLNTHIGETGSTQAKTQAINWANGSITEYCGRVFDIATYCEWYRATGRNRVITKQWPIKAESSVLVMESAPAVTVAYAGIKGAIISTGKILTLLNGSAVTTLLYADYTSIDALITAINLVSGFSAIKESTAGFHSQLAECSYSVISGSIVTLENPATVIDCSVDTDSGIISGITYNSLVFVQYTAGYDPLPESLEIIATQMAAALLKTKPESLAMKSETFGDYSYTVADHKDIVQPYERILRQWRRV